MLNLDSGWITQQSTVKCKRKYSDLVQSRSTDHTVKTMQLEEKTLSVIWKIY